MSTPRNPANYVDKGFFGTLINDLPNLDKGSSVHFYIDDEGNKYFIKMFSFVTGRGIVAEKITFDKGPSTIGNVIINKKFTLAEIKQKYKEALETTSDDSLPW